MDLSGYKCVWLFVMFDLPVKTAKDRKRYRKFARGLKEYGFTRLQYSVFARFYQSEERAVAHKNVVRAGLPPEGHVRMLIVTDVQFSKMESFFGGKRVELERKPEQLQLF